MAINLVVSQPALGMDNDVFKDAMVVRTLVFIEEQSVPIENEIDGDEPRCWHWACYHEDANGARTPIGAIRLVTPPHPSHEEGPEKEPEGNYLKVGRLATVKEFRGMGVGKLLVDTAVEFAGANRELVGCRDLAGKRIEGEWDGRTLAHAQVNVKRVWEKMGFTLDEEMGEWIEEGILHCGMWRKS